MTIICLKYQGTSLKQTIKTLQKNGIFHFSDLVRLVKHDSVNCEDLRRLFGFIYTVWFEKFSFWIYSLIFGQCDKKIASFDANKFSCSTLNNRLLALSQILIIKVLWICSEKCGVFRITLFGWAVDYCIGKKRKPIKYKFKTFKATSTTNMYAVNVF